jgi:hypothetical protein
VRFTQCFRRSIAAEAITLTRQSNQTAFQQKGFFAARAFTLQIRQNLGCNLFAGEPVAFKSLCKKLLCPATHVATIVLPDFARSCSAEGKRKLILPNDACGSRTTSCKLITAN